MAGTSPAMTEAKNIYYRPRETRSISARTMRSTRLGRLSSSHDLSIGRSISFTRSSSVRAFCPMMVCASVLNALSTAAIVSFEISPRSMSGGGLRFVVNTTSDAPSLVRKPWASLGGGGGAGGGTGAAIASVRSNTSGVDALSGLLAGASAGVGAGFGAGGAAVVFAGAGGGVGRPGAAVIPGCCFAAGAASGAFAGLLASSSAMMRRMEARISSIEGSCAFAACVITRKTRHAARSPRGNGRTKTDANHCRYTAYTPEQDVCGRWKCAHNALWTWDHDTAVDSTRSAAVWSAHAGPCIAYLLVVHVRVIDRHPQSQHLRRQPSHRRQKREGSNYPVALRAHQRHPRVHQFLLRVQHIERGALANARFLAHPVQCDLGRLHLRLRRLDIGFRCIKLPPRLYDVLPHLVARRLKIKPPLPQRLLRLPHQRILRPALIDRDDELGDRGGVKALELVLGDLVLLLHAALHRQRRIKRAFRNLHLQQRRIDIVLCARHRRVRRRGNPDRLRLAG